MRDRNFTIRSIKFQLTHNLNWINRPSRKLLTIKRRLLQYQSPAYQTGSNNRYITRYFHRSDRSQDLHTLSTTLSPTAHARLSSVMPPDTAWRRGWRTLLRYSSVSCLLLCHAYFIKVPYQSTYDEGLVNFGRSDFERNVPHAQLKQQNLTQDFSVSL